MCSSIGYNAHFDSMPPRLTHDELVDHYTRGLPLNPQERLDAERILNARVAKAMRRAAE